MNKRILIAEDNEQNLYLISFLLEKNGFEILVARTGAEAIEQARAARPDLILIDIQMPEMDGYEAIERLKRLPETSRIPVVVVSSYAMAGDRERALRLGCAGYIEKPITPETFAAQIGDFLGDP